VRCPRKRVDSKVVLHPAVCQTEGRERLELFGHDRVARVGTKLRRSELGQHYRVLNIVRLWRHGIAVADVDLKLAAGAIDRAQQPDT
jgi:hypothetical protein